jgi:hypothetical protein
MTATALTTAATDYQGITIAADGHLPFNSANYTAADYQYFTKDGYILMTVTGTFTAGTGLVVLDYVQTLVDLSTTDVGG